MSLERLIDGIEKQAAESIKAETGDYYDDDGLLVCGKCNTRKQTKIVVFDKVRTPFCLCKCEVEKRDREEEERKRVEFMERVMRMRRAGFPDADMKNMTFANDDLSNEKLSKVARNYVEHFDEMRKRGKGLIFYGGVGVGKTFIAASIANALIDKGFPCLVTNFSRLINTISGMFEGKQEYIDSLNNFDLLVIDDLATERDTEYTGEIVQNIIDSRYRAGLPIIVTTNLSGEELQNPAEIRKQRIYSRIYDMCLPVKVEGRDRRRREMREAVKEFSDLLGL